MRWHAHFLLLNTLMPAECFRRYWDLCEGNVCEIALQSPGLFLHGNLCNVPSARPCWTKGRQTAGASDHDACSNSLQKLLAKTRPSIFREKQGTPGDCTRASVSFGSVSKGLADQFFFVFCLWLGAQKNCQPPSMQAGPVEAVCPTMQSYWAVGMKMQPVLFFRLLAGAAGPSIKISALGMRLLAI